MSASNSYLFQGDITFYGFLEVIETMAFLLKQLLWNYKSNHASSTHKSMIFQTEVAIFWTHNEKQIIEKELALLLGIVSRKN